MKNFIKVLLIFVIAIILILFLLLFLLNNKNNSGNVNIIGDEGDLPEISNEEVIVTEPSKIKTVEACIQKYYDIIDNTSSIYYGKNDDGKYEKVKTDIEINKYILGCLSEDYIENNSINENNLDNYIKKSEEKLMAIALNMKEVINIPTEKFFVYGKLINLEYEDKGEFYLYVNLDNKNNTFSIEPINNKNIDFENTRINNGNSSIPSKNNNKFENVIMENEDIARDLLNRYKKIVLSNASRSYDYINNEYKKEKYNNVKEYIEYINSNRDRIEKINLSKYIVNYNNDYTQYVCIDKNNNYFIINEKSLIDFDIMLDSYTIDYNEFREKYNEGSEQIKVGMNIEKIISAVNNKDYTYIYKKLNDNFKNTYFKTIKDLKLYLEDNYFDINKVDYGSFSQRGGDVFVYELKIQSANDQDLEEKDMTIIMKLDEDLDFEIAFEM